MNRKAIFDTVRRLLGRGFRQGEVNSLDAAIDAAMRETGNQLAQEQGGKLGVSQAGIDLIKRFEGLAKLIPGGKVAAYPDPGTGGAPWTVGFGATMIEGKPVTPTTVITLEQAEALLRDDIERHARDVRALLRETPTTQGQFDALASFHFNTGALGRSTLLKLHKAGDYGAAAKEFPRWNRAGNRVLRGLVRRREAERALYLS